MSASSASFPEASLPRSGFSLRAPGGIAWYVWGGVLAVLSSSIGGTWDVAWHRSIGRDSFLTPAHILIYACGVIAAIVCGYLIFATTFGHSQRMKDVAVNVLGFRAPLGAFIAAWGGIAMIVSAPFDNWWHAAYGLDVKIVSPPHTLLILGIRGVGVGILFLIVAAMNRAAAAGNLSGQRAYVRIFLFLGGLMVVGQMFFIVEFTWDVELHSTGAYIALGIAVPALLALLARASGSRWAATITSAIYMLWGIGEILILPLVPATPKLGPVFFPVTHLVPMTFPVLLVIPALACDLLWHRLRAWKPWQIAIVTGVVFIAIVFIVEWNFGTFLLSKASENRFFGTIYFDYNSRPDSYERLRQFFAPASGLFLLRGLTIATLCAMVSTWLGIQFGDWMKSVQR